MTGAGWTWDRALCGIVPPAISPLDAGREVDEAAIGVLVEHVLRAGCSGLFVLGGCGEGAWLLSRQRGAVIRAFVRAAAVPGPSGAVFNVCTGIQTTVGDLVSIARRTLGVAAEPEWGSYPARSWDTNVWVGDNAAIRKALGWTPTLTIGEGFERTAGWLAENAERLRYYRDSIASSSPTRAGGSSDGPRRGD